MLPSPRRRGTRRRAIPPTPRRRRLGAELRRIREALGWTQEEAANRLGYRSFSTVSKIEKGVQGLKIQQLPHFFEVYEITDPSLREGLRDLVRRAETSCPLTERRRQRRSNVCLRRLLAD